MSDETNTVYDDQQAGEIQTSNQPDPGQGQQPPNLVELLPEALVPILQKEREFLEKTRSELTDLLKQGITVEGKILNDWGAASGLADPNPSLSDFAPSKIDEAKAWLEEKREEKQKELEALEKKKMLIEDTISTMGELAKNKISKINNLIAQLKSLPKQRDELQQLIDKLEEELETAPPDDGDLIDTIEQNLKEAKDALDDLKSDEQNYNDDIKNDLQGWREARKKIGDLIVDGLQDVTFEIDKTNKDLDYMKKYENAILKKHLESEVSPATT